MGAQSCVRGITDLKSKGAHLQIAHAWLLAQKPRIVPNPGTTKLHYPEEVKQFDI
jgi:aryl-alcohol dehydrogenase-like predicted oxidoreductase